MTFYDVLLGQIAQPGDLNQLVDTLNTLNYPAEVFQNGSTSGRVSLYQPLQGFIKVAVITFVNFRNNGGSTQGVILPVSFAGRSKLFTGDVPSTGISFQSGGSSRTIAVVTGLSTTAPTTSNVTVYQGRGMAEILGGWDTMIIPSGGSAVTDGVILVVGS